MVPDLYWERICWQDGYRLVAGVDEAGRGALAGPIVAAAAVFRPGTRLAGHLALIDDSKKLSPALRRTLAAHIRSRTIAWSVGEASPAEIDEFGINRANRLCMERAVEGLGISADVLLVDAITCELECPQVGLIDGDALSISIAAASILAKTFRDERMHLIHQEHSAYGFDRHVGYGTAAHLAALREHGPCEHHRRSFAGVLAPAQP